MIGEAFTCPRCGGLYEAPVDLGGGVSLAGHVPGGDLCRQRPAPRKAPEARREVAVPARSVFEMTEDEKRAREEQVRALLRKGSR